MTDNPFPRDPIGRFLPGVKAPTRIQSSERGRELVRKRWDDHYRRAGEAALVELQKRGFDIGPSELEANDKAFGLVFSMFTEYLISVMQKEDKTAADLRDIQRPLETWLKSINRHPDQEIVKQNLSVTATGPTAVFITPGTMEAINQLQQRHRGETVDAEPTEVDADGDEEVPSGTA